MLSFKKLTGDILYFLLSTNPMERQKPTMMIVAMCTTAAGELTANALASQENASAINSQ